ncbi:PHD finger protein At1g33420-like [Syzygium oleosum]|uniref:PHD finger protein At1g33420-like n=1 Tax=Syzygium oleosum TaxID=219896 RepID=UPI0011D2083F|nr:PHD finger protein At1g33420-like [Syzygium oleosum]
MVVSGRPMKRMKRRVTADLSDFLTFPSSSSSSSTAAAAGGGRGAGGAGPFRARVKEFLSRHAVPPPPPSSLFPHLTTWPVLFRVGDVVTGGGPDPSPATVCLDVVEEEVSRSRSVYCDQCRVVGWSGHPVCGKRYHFIIKADGSSIGGHHKPCICCGDLLHFSESRCKSCNHVMTEDDVEDWVFHQLENTTHLLHAVVHSNGFGHLLRVNGREGGSRFLSGCHIMDFWDRLCKTLGVRKVSVMDVSKKFGLEYRLLHAVTKGHPWYGEWGYEFGTGSFGITRDVYNRSVESLSSLPLSTFLSQGWNPSSHLPDIISFYQSLSKHELVNIRDLFCFLLSLVHGARKSSSRDGDAIFNKVRSRDCGALGSWTRSEVERVEEAIVRVLRAVSSSNWVSRRALRGAAYRVASAELLDHCLRELRDKSVSSAMVISSRWNPDSDDFEYRLEPGGTASTGNNASGKKSSFISRPSEDNLIRDLRYLYDSILHPHKMLNEGTHTTDYVEAAQRLLDCKQFMKDYRAEEVPSTANPFSISLVCQVELADHAMSSTTCPPPELIILSPNATVSDLKHEVARAFQDVYLMCRRFQADDLLDYRGVDDSTQVKYLTGLTNLVRVRGRCFVKNGVSKYRLERGLENWTVDCKCGAKDDDGERMLACDVCGVWQHTRCSGINDSESVPARFICSRCRSSGKMLKASEDGEDEAKPSFVDIRVNQMLTDGLFML